MDLETFKAADAATYTGGVGAVLMIIRYFFKMFSRDMKDIQTDHESEDVLKNWKEIAQGFKTEAKENAVRADEFAAQRNKALEEIGVLKGEIRVLALTVEHLQSELKEFKEEVELLTFTINSSPKCVECLDVLQQRERR